MQVIPTFQINNFAITLFVNTPAGEIVYIKICPHRKIQERLQKFKMASAIAQLKYAYKKNPEAS